MASLHHAVHQDISRRIHHIVYRTAMPQHNTLGFTGGTGGIDKICQILLGDGDLRLLLLLLLQQLLHIHRRTVREPLQPVRGGDDQSGIGIIDDMAHPLHRIIRITGDIGRAGLQCTEQRKEYPGGSGQQKHHPVSPADAPGQQRMRHPVCLFIQFLIRKCTVHRIDRRLIRSLFRPVLHTGVEEPVRRNLRMGLPLPEGFQNLLTLCIQQIHTAHLVPAGYGKLLQHDGIGGKELIHQLPRVNRIAILCFDGRCTVLIYNTDGKAEFRIRDLHSIGGFQPRNFRLLNDAPLIFIHHIYGIAPVGCDLREGIILVLQRFLQALCHRTDVIIHCILRLLSCCSVTQMLLCSCPITQRLLCSCPVTQRLLCCSTGVILRGDRRQLRRQGHSIYKHTKGIREPDVGPAAGYGCDIDLIRCREPGQGIIQRGQEEGRFLHTCPPAGPGNRLRIHGLCGNGFLPRISHHIHISRQLRGGIIIRQQLCKISIVGLPGLACQKALLILYVCEVRRALLLHCMAGKSLTQLLQEQIRGEPVKDQMVEYHQQMYRCIRLRHCKPEQRSLIQMEGDEEIRLLLLKFLLRQLPYRDHRHLHLITDGHHLIIHDIKMHEYRRIRLQHLLYGVCNLPGIRIRGKVQYHGDVVHGAFRLLHAFHIDAGLGRTERNRCILCRQIILCPPYTALHPGLQDPVLDACDGDVLHLSYRKIDTELLHQAGGKPDHTEAGEAQILQRCAKGRILHVQRFSDHLLQGDLQHIIHMGGILLRYPDHRLRQRLLIHLTVLVHRDLLDLHE